jgi:CheY-like chemotaxis protein
VCSSDLEELIREIIAVALEGHGYRVLTAGDGTEALALYTQHREHIAVVVTDMAMPYLDGPATIRALQRMKPDIRVIAVSGINDTARLGKASTGKPIPFILKPFTTEKLLLALHEVLCPVTMDGGGTPGN